MSDTLTFGLVQITNRAGQERTQLLADMSGTYLDGYCCEDCGRVFTEDDAQSGSVWQCDDCSEKFEMGADESPETCGNCENTDSQNFTRLDGRDGSAEGIICSHCSNALMETVELFRCDDCGDLLNLENDSEAEHLYEHLNDTWK